MKKKSKEILIVSQVYEEACLWSENIYNLKQTIKKVKKFYKSKSGRKSAEC